MYKKVRNLGIIISDQGIKKQHNEDAEWLLNEMEEQHNRDIFIITKETLKRQNKENA